MGGWLGVLFPTFTPEARSKFCERCGAPMEWRTFRKGVIRYDRLTGEPVVETRREWVCPTPTAGESSIFLTDHDGRLFQRHGYWVEVPA